MPDPAAISFQWRWASELGSEERTASGVPPPRRYPGRVLVALSGLASLGCSGLFGPHPDVARAQQELDAARARWNDAGTGSYLFELDRSLDQTCSGCIKIEPPAKVEVRADTVSLITWGGIRLWDNASAEYAVTVPDLFDIIQARSDLADKPNSFFVEYDAALGYPTTIHITPQPPVSPDRGFVATIVSLTALDPLAVRRARERLDAARVRWSDAGIGSYAFELDKRCFCPPGWPVRIEVSAGMVRSVTHASTGEPAPVGRFGVTVPDLFNSIQSSIGFAYRADFFFTAYHADLGYPTIIHVRPPMLHSGVSFEVLSLTIVDGSAN